MEKQHALIFIVIILVLGVGYLTFRLSVPVARTPAQNAIGGDHDAKGCIGSAGYSWSEERQQCVRVWEVPIMIEAESALKIQLAQKYSKPADNISIKVTKIDNNHVAGSVNFAPAENIAGGLFLAFKESGIWKLVYDGNGSVDCNTLRAQGFSDLILSPQFCE